MFSCSAAPRRVYAVDVGRGQLAEALRRDERVVSMERLNARTLTATTLPEPIDLAVVDVSFISLALVLGPVASTLQPGARARIVALVKPQFEAGRGRTDHGVVRDPAVHREVLERVIDQATRHRAGCPGADRLADPRAGGQPRVPRRVPPRRRVRRPGHRDRRRDRPVTIRRIGFAYNPTSEAAIELRERAAGWCAVRGIDQWAAQAGDFDALCADLPTTDVLVVLGGDGTFLRAARAVIQVDVPLLGINLGKVGFLSKAEASELETVLAKLVAGEFTIGERMALEARILPGGRESNGPPHHALNDVVIARGALARVCRLDVAIGPSHLATFIADGLVVSSPTGSTGYSFSAGGPVVDPLSRNLIVTPIAGYLSAIRSVVVSPKQTVRCRVVDANEALVSIDGREDLPIVAGDAVEVRALERPVRLVEPAGDQPFWDLFRRKVELLPS